MTPQEGGLTLATSGGSVARDRQRYLLACAALLALRLFLLLMLRHSPFSNDGGEYADMARQLASGQHFVPYWPPGLPLYLVPFVASPTLIRVSMLLFWIIATWSLWRMLKAMELTPFAWALLLVFGLLPDSMLLSVDPLTQLPVAALLLVACSAAVRIVRGLAVRPLAEFLLLGAALGWAALIRPSASVLLCVLPIACAAWSRRWAAPAAGLVLGLAMVGAWMLHVRATTGHTLINTANGKNLYLGNNPWTPDYKTWYFGSHAKEGDDLDEYPEYAQQVRAVERGTPEQASAEYQHLAQVEIVTHPGTFALRTLNRMRCFWGFDTFAGAQAKGHRWLHLPLSPLTLAAEALLYLALILPASYWLARTGREFWRRPEVILIAMTILLYSAPYWLSMSHPTYHYPVLALVVVLGVMAFAQRKRAAAPWRGLAAIAGMLLIQAEWVWQMTRGIS